MNRIKRLNRISELLARLSVQVAIQNTNAMYDINILAEDFLVPLLNKVYGCSLSNAKYEEDDNSFPGVDLIDRKNRISFQVTSTASLEKVKYTIRKIIKYELYKDFDKFYVYIITQKNDNYNIQKLKQESKGLIQFEESNILDQGDLFKKISSFSIEKIQEIERILEHELGDSQKTDILLSKQIPVILAQLNTDLSYNYLSEELRGYHETRLNWLKKKIFFEKEEPITFDANQKYSLQEHVSECSRKIFEIDNLITSTLVKINSNADGR